VSPRDEEKQKLAKALGVKADQIDWSNGDANVCH
jgi:hypothetical protein